MPDLQTELRRYGAQLEDQYPDVGFDELLNSTAPWARPRPVSRRGLPVALMTAAAVFVFVGGLALFDPFGGLVPSLGSQPTTPIGFPSTSSASTDSDPGFAGTVIVTDDACVFEPYGTQLVEGVLAFTVVNQAEGQAGAHVWGPFAEGRTFGDFAVYLDEEIRLTLAGEPYLGPAPWFGSLIPSDADAALTEVGQSKEIRGVARPGVFGIACSLTFEGLGPRIHAYTGPLEVVGTE